MSAARLIPWALHEVLEYAVGVFLILAPFLFDLRDGVAFPLFVAAGVLVVLLQLLTAGLASIAELLPPRVHATIDYLLAIFLVVAPFVFGFTDQEPALFVSTFTGVGLLVLSLLTAYPIEQPEPSPAAADEPTTTLGTDEAAGSVADRPDVGSEIGGDADDPRGT